MRHRDLSLEMTLMELLAGMELSRTISVDLMLLLDSHPTTRTEKRRVPKKTILMELVLSSLIQVTSLDH
jgi:hypothetical protein